MATRADSQYQYTKPYAKKKKRRRRRNNQLMVNAAAYLIAAAVLIAAGTICWKGIQMVWNGIEGALSLLTPQRPVISILDTAPVESAGGDHEAPVLSGVHDFTIYQADTISYMSGITAADETDSNPTITVDNSEVDLSQPGEYQIVYTATDSSGNISQATATVTVLEKEAGFVDMQTITSTAEAVLETIVWDHATTEEMVRAIYSWARSHISYSGHSDRTDWRQTAYTVLTQCQGDCFGYFAATKLLFEQLEIPNIDVQKVRNYDNDSDHFWSLVSIDDGQSFYHFDATPRWGEGDDFCLVTDAFMDTYSESHKGSHNRDKQRYPATPEESP